jgi:endonuclease/exonuclease/phosphatase family metal-dependent hydrolase
MSIRDLPHEVLVPRDGARLRIATYNINSGLGVDHPMWRAEAGVRRDLSDIARRLAAAGPPDAPLDVVVLNEVDFDARRSHHLDEARHIAIELSRLTGVTYTVIGGQTFDRTFPGLEARFGNALLVRAPTARFDRFRLAAPPGALFAGRSHGWLAGFSSEPRGALRASFEIGGHAIDVVGTHLDADQVSVREAQAIDVLRRTLSPGRATILAGDMNSSPDIADRRYAAGDRTYVVLTSGPLIDARAVVGSDPGQFATVPSTRPRWPIDAIFASAELLPLAVAVLPGTSSDHRGVAATFAFATPEQARRLSDWHTAERRDRVRRLVECEPGAQPSQELARWLFSGTELPAALSIEAREALRTRALGGTATAAVFADPEPVTGASAATRPAG